MTLTNELTADPPGRSGLFTSHATGTTAGLSVTCSALGLAALGLERAMAQAAGQASLGAMLELPVPYISIPLGVGAVTIAASVLYLRPRLALVPVVCAVLYWAVALWMWP